MHISDRDIIDKYRSDKGLGGLLMFERYYKPLVLYANSYLRNPDEAEDIVQDLFLKFIENRNYLTISPAALNAYLFRSTKNRCLNHLRNVRRVVLSPVDLYTFAIIEEDVETFSPEFIERVKEAMNDLPEKMSRTVKAILIDRMSYQQTADLNGVSLNTVKTQLSKGLRMLRSHLSDSLKVFLSFFFV